MSFCLNRDFHKIFKKNNPSFQSGKFSSLGAERSRNIIVQTK